MIYLEEKKTLFNQQQPWIINTTQSTVFAVCNISIIRTLNQRIHPSNQRGIVLLFFVRQHSLGLYHSLEKAPFGNKDRRKESSLLDVIISWVILLRACLLNHWRLRSGNNSMDCLLGTAGTEWFIRENIDFKQRLVRELSNKLSVFVCLDFGVGCLFLGYRCGHSLGEITIFFYLWGFNHSLLELYISSPTFKTIT